MKFSHITSVSTPYYEGDLTEVICDHEYSNNVKKCHHHQYFINKSGKVVAEFVAYTSDEENYAMAEQLSNYREDIFVLHFSLSKSPYYLVIQVVDNEQIILGNYDDIEYGEEEKTFRVQKNNLTGFIDINGVEIIKPQYSSARSFFDGVSIARDINNKWGLINSSNKVIIPFLYDNCDDYRAVDGFVIFQNYNEHYGIEKSFIYNTKGVLINEHNGDVQNLGNGNFVFEIERNIYEIRKQNDKKDNI